MTALAQQCILQAEGEAATQMSLGISGSFAVRFVFVSFFGEVCTTK